MGASTSPRWDVIAPLCLVALVAPHLRRRAGRATVVVAAVVAVIAVPRLPAGTGLLVAAAAGCLAGELAGRGRQEESSTTGLVVLVVGLGSYVIRLLPALAGARITAWSGPWPRPGQRR